MAVLPVTENKPQVNIYESRWKDLTWVYDEYDDHLFIVLYLPVFNQDARVATPSEVDTFIGNGFLVTVHCSADLKPLAKLFKECQLSEEARQEYLGRGSGYLLYRIIDRLEEKERKLFSQEELEAYFGDINDHLKKIWNTLEEYREVTEVLTDTSNWLTSHRIQEVMRVLTIVMATMMPLTVITGIYGMNVRLPLGNVKEGGWHAFIVLLVVMALITGGMLFFFRRRRWI